MKHPLRLLLATTVAASAPLLCAYDASAGDTWWEDRGARFVDTDLLIHDNGDLKITFEEANVGRMWIRYEASAEVRAEYRCVNRNGQLVGGASNRLVVKDTLQEEESFRANRQGRVHGELKLDYDRIYFRDFCRGNNRPVLMRLTFNDIRIKDVTNDKVEHLDRVTRSFRADDAGWWDNGDDRGDGLVRILVP